MNLTRQKFTYGELNVEIISYIDDKQNVWFKGKLVAEILG